MKVVTLKDLKSGDFKTKFEYSLDSGVYKAAFELTDLTATDYGEVVTVVGKAKVSVEGGSKELIKAVIPVDQLNENIEATVEMVKTVGEKDVEDKVKEVAEAGVDAVFKELAEKLGLKDGKAVLKGVKTSDVSVSVEPVITIDVTKACVAGSAVKSTGSGDVEFTVFYVKKTC